MTTVGTKAGGFCFRCSGPDPRIDPAPLPVSTPWPMLAPANGLAYARTNPLVRAIYTPDDLRRVAAVRAERRRHPQPRAATSETGVAALRDWLIMMHEFVHLYYLEWTPAKELARSYLALSYEPITTLMTDDRLSDRAVAAAWRDLQFWTDSLAQIEESVTFVEELIATGVAFTGTSVFTQPGGLWAGFDEPLVRIRAEFLAAEEDVLSGFGAALTRCAPLMRLLDRNAEFAAFLIPLLQPVTRRHRGTGGPPLVGDARSALDTILTLTSGCDSAACVVDRLRDLEREAAADWQAALGWQTAYVREHTGGDSEWRRPRPELARMLWRTGRGDVATESIDEATPEAARSLAEFRARIAAVAHLGHANLVLLQPRRRRRHIAITLHWWADDTDGVPDDVQEAHFSAVVLEGLRQQLLAGQGIVCPRNPEGALRCDCPLAWRKAMLRLAQLARAGAFGPGEWSHLPCRRR